MSPTTVLQLAAGACIISEAGRHVLRLSRGHVALNRLAAVTLRLCDGRNTRDDVIAHLAFHPFGRRRAQDVEAFLDSARKQGWITEA